MPPNKEQRGWLKEFGDALYDPVDGPYHHAGTPNHGYVHLGELYLRGDVACHFHLSVYFAGQSHSHDLCADFQVAVPQRTLSAVGELEIGGGLGGQGFVVKVNHGGSQQEGVECPVFVLVGEFPEGSQRSTRGVRSIVGLRDVDNCPLRPWDFSEMYPLVREPLATVLNRELNLVAQAFRLGDAKVVDTERIEQVVEGAAEIMYDIPQDDADAESPILWNCCDSKDMLARLRLQLGVELNKIGFGGTSACDGPNYGLKGIAMLVRPLNLGPTLGKVNRHG